MAAGQALDYQPRSAICAKKKQLRRLIKLAQAHEDWALGYLDEVWWSRLAQPKMHSWTFAAKGHRPKPLRLQQKSKDKKDPDRQALACYGVWFEQSKKMLLRFVTGRPVSHVTIEFLEWVLAHLTTEGKRVWVLVWDNASWHTSQKVRRWIAQHNEQAKRTGGVRLLVCPLPVKSPWLNPIEPRWLHGKRAIVEPSRKLTAQETMERICAHYGCDLLKPIEQ